MNQFKCSKCGHIINKDKDVNAATCPECGFVATLKLQLCPYCGEQKYFAWRAKGCRQCYAKNIKSISAAYNEDPVELREIRKGKSPVITKLINYNWWSANEFARAVAKCTTDAEAEQLHKDFLRGASRIQHRGNSWANNYEVM